MTEIQRDITRGVLAVLFIVALIGSSIWILRPFLGAIVWATTIVVATWPLMIAAQGWLWGKGELATERLVRFGHRLAGSGGENAVYLAGQTIRGVALGVVVTALAQTVFSGLGVMIAGVPFAGVLTAVMLLLAIAQIGVVPVLGAATAWLFWTGDTPWGQFLLVWTVGAGPMDNFF